MITSNNVSALYIDNNFTVGYDITLGHSQIINNEIVRICSIKGYQIKMIFDQDDNIIRIEPFGENASIIKHLPLLLRQYGTSKHESAAKDLMNSKDDVYFDNHIIGISYDDGYWINFCIYLRIGNNYFEINGIKTDKDIYFNITKFNYFEAFFRTICYNDSSLLPEGMTEYDCQSKLHGMNIVIKYSEVVYHG